MSHGGTLDTKMVLYKNKSHLERMHDSHYTTTTTKAVTPILLKEKDHCHFFGRRDVFHGEKIVGRGVVEGV